MHSKQQFLDLLDSLRKSNDDKIDELSESDDFTDLVNLDKELAIRDTFDLIRLNVSALFTDEKLFVVKTWEKNDERERVKSKKEVGQKTYVLQASSESELQEKMESNEMIFGYAIIEIKPIELKKETNECNE